MRCKSNFTMYVPYISTTHPTCDITTTHPICDITTTHPICDISITHPILCDITTTHPVCAISTTLSLYQTLHVTYIRTTTYVSDITTTLQSCEHNICFFVCESQINIISNHVIGGVIDEFHPWDPRDLI